MDIYRHMGLKCGSKLWTGLPSEDGGGEIGGRKSSCGILKQTNSWYVFVYEVEQRGRTLVCKLSCISD